ncbi:DNA repair protein RecN [Nocardioides baekrokdamisoli]|uniref:DNA repair protein RecN n=1 Tax=Nocardioides baekrokdamisoli TaxID=1804624 RepID=A0A3G9ICI4_9ACTN|nr:DNA repair protein RecN [Nocardioides baekrokdamisoli]BBH16056.1 DNA repair protein RecN [Nocardioides baekrokdamisoli]
MLEELRISGLGVIDSASVDLGPGLTVITGETGAGKTMIVTALNLLLGQRADSGAVRTGARQARVEGVLNVRGAVGLAESVDELGGEVEDDRVLVSRSVASVGRPKTFVGGAAVPTSTLAATISPHVVVHGQSDQGRLLQTKHQRGILDRYAGLGELLGIYRDAYSELASVEEQLAVLVSAARERVQEADLLRYGLNEVEAAEPKLGEDDELRAEEQRLGYVDNLRTAAENAHEALSNDGGSDAMSLIAAARRQIDGVREHDAAFAALGDRLAEVQYLLSDVAADLAAYGAGLDVDPHRLAAVSERRAVLAGLTRKYGDTIDEVLAWAEQAAARVGDLDDTDGTIETLRTRRAALRATIASVGTEISTRRQASASTLAASVTDELTHLAMPNALLAVDVRQRSVEAPANDLGAHAPIWTGEGWLQFGSSGLDEVEFLIAANTGSPPRPLAKSASGGELSRVMLALEVVVAATSPVPTFVFDEVDAGIGGSAGVDVGRRLAMLARSAQVLVVTHLPQVAAYADTHVVVNKSSEEGVTSSDLRVLTDDEREQELSRMLAGLEGSETALAHARELREVARAAAGRN